MSTTPQKYGQMPCHKGKNGWNSTQVKAYWDLWELASQFDSNWRKRLQLLPPVLAVESIRLVLSICWSVSLSVICKECKKVCEIFDLHCRSDYWEGGHEAGGVLTLGGFYIEANVYNCMLIIWAEHDRENMYKFLVAYVDYGNFWCFGYG